MWFRSLHRGCLFLHRLNSLQHPVFHCCCQRLVPDLAASPLQEDCVSVLGWISPSQIAARCPRSPRTLFPFICLDEDDEDEDDRDDEGDAEDVSDLAVGQNASQ